MSVGLLVIVLMLTLVGSAMFWPLRHKHRPDAGEGGDTALEIARDSKLAEISDLEVDFRVGKLSADDYRATNAVLRAEAVEIMRQLEAASTNGRRAVEQTWR